ncbi:carbonate dehydratase [Thiorhodospira sibirica]|uniref:carbonate dehydratase n=1 Tax=Thiorhodospira sibirica TaxID=154347 RepID=UPI00022C52DD|nr:carbonate dehydratase [Thiorhodospira sibirica]
MIRKNPSGDLPVVAESAFVDPTAILCGKVIVGENVFIGPYAVIRADELNPEGGMEPIIIGDNSNIQDGVVIHSKSGARVEIGCQSSIAHRSIVHGPCQVGNRVFIGFNTVLFNCTVGEGAMIRHNSVVEGCTIPAHFYVPSATHIQSNADLELIDRITPDAANFSEDVAQTNIDLARRYKRIQNEL